MNPFTYCYPTKAYFGENAAANNLAAELAEVGTNVMLAYGGGSIKKNGIYDELLGVLKDAGKTVTEFAGIMSNLTYAKVQEGAVLAKEKNIDFTVAVPSSYKTSSDHPGTVTRLDYDSKDYVGDEAAITKTAWLFFIS